MWRRFVGDVRDVGRVGWTRWAGGDHLSAKDRFAPFAAPPRAVHERPLRGALPGC